MKPAADGMEGREGKRAAAAGCAAGLAAFALFYFLPVKNSTAAPAPEPAELKPATVEAFEQYVRLTTARNDEELRRGSPFLLVDSLPEPQRQQAYAALRAGEVRIERLETLHDGHPMDCPDGLIHHWVGVIFIPGATLEQTLRLVEDYDHHATYYAPDVQRAKILARQGDDFTVVMRFRRKKVVTVVLDTVHQIHYGRLDATRAFSRSATTRVAEVENPGQPDEHEKPAGHDGGYLWGMNTWWRFVERDGGTYVQSESVSLTRNIPAVVKWLVGPFVTSIPREALTFTLTATRNALRNRASVAAH